MTVGIGKVMNKVNASYEFQRIRKIALSKDIDIETWPDELKPIVHVFNERKMAAKYMLSIQDAAPEERGWEYTYEIVRKCDEMICEFFGIERE